MVRPYLLKKMSKKQEENKQILENPQVLAEKLGWLERNPKISVGIVVVLLLVVGGYFGYSYYKNNQEREAQREMYQAVYYFESDSLDLALNGDGNNLGFLNIVEEFGITDAANLANYYAGACYLKQGKFELARLYLEDFSANDLLVQPHAYSLIGDAYMEEEDFENAAKFYNKAATYKPNKFYTPMYLMKEALAYEKLNNVDKAKATYQIIIDKYWESNESQSAQKLKERLDTNS